MKHLLNRLWEANAPLTATAILMLVDFVACLVGMLIDPRIITGVSAWLKPTKFAISSVIYCGTVAWLFTYLATSSKWKSRFGWTIALMINLEIVIIDLQAARGTTSHFNAGTILDGVLFGIMGTGIALLLVGSIGVLVLLMRQPFADAPWGWALRLGFLITVIGSAAGGLMLHPTPEQAAHHFSGGHTVGALDGGAGLPLLGWSAEHGDLRIPHFFGLHAVQVIPFLAFLVRRRRRPLAIVVTASASYFLFITILTWQALRGESIVQPSTETLTAVAFWLVASAAALISTQFMTKSVARVTA